MQEALGVEEREIEVGPRARHRVGGSRDHLRLEGAQLRFHDIGAEEEIARIPEVAVGDVALGGCAVRLLDETLELVDIVAFGERGAGLDVAVARRRMIRLDAEGHDVSAARRLGRLAAELHEGRLVAHDMIGGEHRDDRVRPHAHRQFRGDRHRRTRVAPLRLENNMRGAADLLQLLADQEAIGVVRDDDRHVEHVVGKHLDRHLEGRPLAHEGNELLREALARLGPYACPRAAAHDDGKYLHCPTLVRGASRGPFGSIRPVSYQQKM